MTSLHQYEAWLDELDAQLRADGENIVCTLGSGWSVPVRTMECADDVAHWAKKLQEFLDAHGKSNNADYLLKRFARLAKEATALPMDADQIAWEVTVGYRRT